MNPSEVERMQEEYGKQIQEGQLATEQARLSNAQADLMMQEESKGMIAEQLDLGEDIERIHNLLRGYVLKKIDGKTQWTKPEDNDMVIFSDYGVNYVMGSIQWYLNKNTLLSNYDDDQIRGKMEDISTTLVDDIFMEYDKMFLYPTLKDCKDEMRRRIKHKVDVRKFAKELLEQEINGEEIENEIIKDMEFTIEKELEVIRQQKIKNKLKRFDSIVRFIQDTIHSAYQRAWKGQERTTLRQHTHISETRGNQSNMLPKQSINPLSFLRR